MDRIVHVALGTARRFSPKGEGSRPGVFWNQSLTRSPYVAGGVLALACFWVYASSLTNGFVYDDEPQILLNPFVLNSSLWRRIFTGSVWSFQGARVHDNFYRPLQMLAYSLVYHLAGPNPAAFHTLQLLAYAASAVLVYRLGKELVRNESVALVGALLWVLHPLHVESVAWIAALPDVGYGFFCLLGFWLFVRAENAKDGRAWRRGSAALAYLPALFFKEAALSFPLLLIAYWVFLGHRAKPDGWKARAWCFVPYVADVIAYLGVRRWVMGGFSPTSRLWSVSPRVLTSSVALLGEHLRLFLWPRHLSAFRSFEPATSLRSAWPWLAVAVLVAALALRKRQPRLAFLVTWWLITLLPCLDIRQLSVPLVADRFSYLPSVGLCLALAFMFIALLRRRIPSRMARLVPVVAITAVMGFWCSLTLRTIPNWRDDEVLMNHALEQSPEAPWLHSARAVVLRYRYKDLEGARREYETALRLNQASVRPMATVRYDAYLGLGGIAEQKGWGDQALDYYAQAVRVLPNFSPAYDSLGSFHFARGDYTRAAEYFAEAVRVNPQDLGARFYLGTCHMKFGHYREAAREFHAAAAVDPTYQQACEAEARALEAAGDPNAAAAARRLSQRGD